MSTTARKRPEPCGHENCGSRRFQVGNDGFTYCSRGHQQSERGTVVAEDTGEFRVTGRKARRKDSDAESTTSRASGYKGPRAFEHYLLCLQLILRQKLRWLIETKNLPEELEGLTRDLWALELRSLRSRVSSYDSETETDTQSRYFSSQSEGETSASEATARSRRRSRTRIDGTPCLLDTLATCYLGIVLLREPVTVADIHRWASDGRLLFYGASKAVPLGMRERLPPVYQELLEPNPLGKPEKLQKHVLDLLATFSTEFGMALPPLNHPLILYGWVKSLALPIEAYAGTTRLARMLDITFEFMLDTKLGTKDVVLRYPEPRLMALLVVTTKILFPFDDVKRTSSSATAMDALRMDWSAWADLHTPSSRDGEESSLGHAAALDFSQTDVLGAAEHELDQYMDWCEQNTTSEDVRERGRAGRDADFRRMLFRMFPAQREAMRRGEGVGSQRSPEDVTTERLREVQAALKPGDIRDLPDRAHTKANDLGSFYRRHRSAEELNGTCRSFYQKAAEMAGLSLEGMVRAVFLVESKLQKREEMLRKEAAG